MLPVGQAAFGQALQVHQVGLDRREAAPVHFVAQRAQIVQRLDRFDAQLGSVTARAHRTAVRPVEAQAIAQLAAEQLPHRCTQRLAANVPQGRVDARHRLPSETTGVPNRSRG